MSNSKKSKSWRKHYSNKKFRKVAKIRDVGNRISSRLASRANWGDGVTQHDFPKNEDF